MIEECLYEFANLQPRDHPLTHGRPMTVPMFLFLGLVNASTGELWWLDDVLQSRKCQYGWGP